MCEASHKLCSVIYSCLCSYTGDLREGINTSVSTDVQSVFKGKTYSQLQALHMNIENKMQAGGLNLDIGYWESLLQQVRVYMARARYESSTSSVHEMLYDAYDTCLTDCMLCITSVLCRLRERHQEVLRQKRYKLK